MTGASIFEPGQRCGPYIIHQRVDRGEPETYVARHEKTRMPVFLQCADERRPGVRPAKRPRFFALVDRLRAIKSPYICSILEAGVHKDDVCWIAAEHTAGYPLDRLFPRGKRASLREVLARVLFIADALITAHIAGILHGNLSPQSVMITEGSEPTPATLKVLGIGTAQLFGLSPSATQGSPRYRVYRAPEQLAGRPIDARSDIYSLGALLYELVEGHPLRSNVDFTRDVASTAPKPLRALGSEIMPLSPLPVEGCRLLVNNVIRMAIENAPEDRYETCEELWNTIKAIIDLGQAAAEEDLNDDADLCKEWNKGDAKHNDQEARRKADDAYYVKTHMANEGLSSGFLPRGTRWGAELEEDAGMAASKWYDIASNKGTATPTAPFATTPPPAQRSPAGAAPKEDLPRSAGAPPISTPPVTQRSVTHPFVNNELANSEPDAAASKESAGPQPIAIEKKLAGSMQPAPSQEDAPLGQEERPPEAPEPPVQRRRSVTIAATLLLLGGCLVLASPSRLTPRLIHLENVSIAPLALRGVLSTAILFSSPTGMTAEQRTTGEERRRRHGLPDAASPSSPLAAPSASTRPQKPLDDGYWEPEWHK